MPNSTFASIIALIKTKLEGLVDGNGKAIFREVYDYPEGEFSDGYPVAVVRDLSSSGEVMDTSRNERTFSFEVVLYEEMLEGGAKNKKESTENLRAITDEVIKAFDADPQLSGNVMRVLVVEAEMDFTSRAGTFNFAKFIIEAKDFVSTC